jgi:hypothetical protein
VSSFIIQCLLILPVLLLSFSIFYGLRKLVRFIRREAAWSAEFVRRMTEGRPALADLDYLDHFSKALSDADAQLWLAVRDAFAYELGWPATAIYPDDDLAPFCRYIAIDFLGIIFRIERSRRVKIPREEFDRRWREAYSRNEVPKLHEARFADLVRIMVSSIQRE